MLGLQYKLEANASFVATIKARLEDQLSANQRAP